MRVLIVTTDWLDAISSRKNLSDWAHKHYGWNVDLISPPSENGVNKKDINTTYRKHYIQKKRGLTISNCVHLRSIIAKNSYNIIILRGLESIILYSLISRKRKVKIIFLLTGLGRLFDEKLPFSTIVRFIYKQSLRIITNIHKATIIVQNKEDQKDLNFKNINIINGSGVPIPKVRGKKNYNGIKIVTASRLVESKGIHEIIDLAQRIQNKPNISYTILGDYSKLNFKLIELIQSLNTSSNVKFLGHVDDISPHLNDAIFAFYPTRYREGVPRFLIESTSYGLIPITTTATGCEQFLNHGIKYNSVSQVIKCMEELKEDTLRKMSYKNLKLFEEKFEETKVFKALIDIVKRAH